jgi:hypothetical protein
MDSPLEGAGFEPSVPVRGSGNVKNNDANLIGPINVALLARPAHLPSKVFAGV